MSGVLKTIISDTIYAWSMGNLARVACMAYKTFPSM